MMQDQKPDNQIKEAVLESKLERLMLVVLFLAIVALLGFLISVIFYG